MIDTGRCFRKNFKSAKNLYEKPIKEPSNRRVSSTACPRVQEGVQKAITFFAINNLSHFIDHSPKEQQKMGMIWFKLIIWGIGVATTTADIRKRHS